MQKRHNDRKQYFEELANTSRRYYIPHLQRHMVSGRPTRVLEIGCGEGGNLLPFAEAGCAVTGIDINAPKIESANQLFEKSGQSGTFILSDFMAVEPPIEEEKYDIVIVHDVIEHIEAPFKTAFMKHMKLFMREDAVAFFAFPAWQMPFGGHQQICAGKISKIPYIHLLPTGLYRRILHAAGESDSTIEGLLSIKRSKMPIEKFERLAKNVGLKPESRSRWLINPHYEEKFGLHPRREVFPFSSLRWVRNFYTTSVWYLLRRA